MSRNSIRIKQGIRSLVQAPHVVFSGKVVPGSVDESAFTVSVLPTNSAEPIKGVMLGTTTGNGNGAIMIPEGNSDVVVGSIDGTGQWTILRTGVLKKVKVTIGNVACTIEDDKIRMENGGVLFEAGTATFKMNSATESLYQLLFDLLTALKDIVLIDAALSTSSILIFETIRSRIENLLTD
ncbi:MAG: hypothetical protein V4649_04485 [Bacteroidota bacterium]